MSSSIPEITGTTSLYGLLGSPVHHSKSPLMHNLSFRYLGLDSVYLCFEILEEQLKTAVDGLKAAGIRGINLTMPNKNRMVELCDHLSPEAKLMQADSMVFQVENAMNEVGDKLDASDKAAVQADLEALKKTLESTPADGTLTDAQVNDIKAGKEKLMESAQKLFAKVYEQAQAAQGGQAGPGPNMGGTAGGSANGGEAGYDDVVDADYKEV